MRISRRRLLGGAAGAVGVAVLRRTGLTQVEVPPDPTKLPGRPLSDLGERSPFQRPRRVVGGGSQGPPPPPLQNLCGIVTPAALHYERHNAGAPSIDPHPSNRLIHGRAVRPTFFD